MKSRPATVTAPQRSRLRDRPLVSAPVTHLLPDSPIPDLDAYRAAGGCQGLKKALDSDPADVVGEIRRSGLRGRGGAGFPTGIKWEGAATEDADHRYVVCNAAEGEPGTFKDRALIRYNPYQLLEGLAVAGHAVGAEDVFIGVKERFEAETRRLQTASAEMAEEGLLDHVELRIVAGPDDYLFGEETGLLEVIEGRDPLPRLYPPYIQGLFTDQDHPSRPTVVNNVETLSNVPHIIARGSDWFRSMGTDDSPGTMVFTVCGDVETEILAEQEMGTPLSYLIHGPAGGIRDGHKSKLVVSGASNRPLTNEELDVPLSFGAMEKIGSGLGAGGFIVYDDSTCIVEVATVLSMFLYEGSCGQCPPCKLGTGAFVERFGDISSGSGTVEHIEEAVAWLQRVTDANRCGLGAGQRFLAAGILDQFVEDVVSCLDGGCPGHRGLEVPMLTDWDSDAGRFSR